MHSTTFDNGLELVVKQNPMSKMVAVQIWVNAGSCHEREGEYGMAHVLEHMLFKGTEKRAVGEISTLIEHYGGDINAFTTFDHTVLFLTLNSQHLELGLDLLADAVFHSSFDEDELEKELKVVLEEISGSEDNPGHKLGQSVFSALYHTTPMGRPVIGFESAVKKFTRKSLLSFYERWYTPENMKLVVVGNVDPLKVQKLSQTYFGSTERHSETISKPDLSLTVAPWGQIRIVEEDCEQARMEIAFHAPTLDDPDQAYLDLAAFVFGAGDSSRLAKVLMEEKQIALAVSCSLFSPSFSGVFGVGIVPAQGKLLECCQEVAYLLYEMMTTRPITPAEIARTQTHLKADRLYNQETVSGQAHSLGQALLSYQGIDHDQIYEGKIDNANPSQVSEVLKRWFWDRPASIFILLSDRKELSEDKLYESFEAGKKTALKEVIPLKDEELVPVIETKPTSEPEVLTLDCGLPLVYRQCEDSSFFNLVAVNHGGLRYDGDTPGLSYLVSQMVCKATASLDAAEYTEEVESSAAMIGGFSGKDSFGYKLQCFHEDWHKFVNLLSDSILRPQFPEKHLQLLKMQVAEEIRIESDHGANIAIRAFQKALYKDHKYGFPLYGSLETVESLTPAIVENAVKTAVRQGSWQLSCVSQFDRETVVAYLNKAFKDWQVEPGKVLDLTASEVEESQNLFFSQEKEQSHLILGVLGLSWSDPQRHALDCLVTILGGSGGRLFVELRDKESLAYSVAPIVNYGVDRGSFAVYLACAPQKLPQAKASIARELEKVCHDEVAPHELERAQNYLVSNHEEEMQKGDAQALTMALMQLYGQGYGDFLKYSESVRRVTLADIKDVANRLWAQQQKVEVVVGPEH